MTGKLLRQSHVASGFDAGKALLAAENERLKAQVAVLEGELDRERHLFPADGVWLVTRDRAESERIARLGEVPDPMSFAALALHRGAIAAAVSRCWSAYRAGGAQAPIDVADAILREVQAQR